MVKEKFRKWFVTITMLILLTGILIIQIVLYNYVQENKNILESDPLLFGLKKLNIENCFCMNDNNEFTINQTSILMKRKSVVEISTAEKFLQNYNVTTRYN